MDQLFKDNITKVEDIFNDVLKDLDQKQLIRDFLKTESYQELKNLNPEQKQAIAKAVNILVQNARNDVTRKMQQGYFMPILQKSNEWDEFIIEFDNNQEFRTKFIVLLIVFVDKSNLHDRDAEHHKHIAKNLINVATKI